MDGALIVSYSEKGENYFITLLKSASFRQISSAKACSEARRLLMERDFNIVIINSPLPDETGERLAREIASKGQSQVMLVVPSEHFDEVSAACEAYGIITIPKPINKTVCWSSLKMAVAVQNRINSIRNENVKLNRKIEDIRIIDRAKCLLISVFRMSEQEAHRFIEKQAMDMRQTKRVIAENIIKSYEN